MKPVDRRAFLVRTAAGLGASLGAPLLCGGEKDVTILRATDTVRLGKTGIRASRLVVGTGSASTEQRNLGVQGLANLLKKALDRGITWWETADIYQTHPHVAAALRDVRRDRVVITTKTASKDAQSVRADIERFLRELGTDVIDILLLHCMSTPDWTTTMEGPMAVLNEAKKKGQVRAVGASLHVHDPRWYASLKPLTAAVDIAWGDIFLVRINPFAVNTDVPKKEGIPHVETIFRSLKQRGAVLYGMKLLGKFVQHLMVYEVIQHFIVNQARPYALDCVQRYRPIEHVGNLLPRLWAVEIL